MMTKSVQPLSPVIQPALNSANRSQPLNIEQLFRPTITRANTSTLLGGPYTDGFVDLKRNSQNVLPIFDVGVTGGLAYSSSIPGVVSKSLEAPPKIPIYAADDFYETFERK